MFRRVRFEREKASAHQEAEDREHNLSGMAAAFGRLVR